jgi:hypothetical protein
MRIEVLKSFAYAHGGTQVVHYTAGDSVDVPNDCAELAIAEGWAAGADGGAKAAKPAGNKARKAAPENK